MGRHHLTACQTAFCVLIADGATKAEAYRTAYGSKAHGTTLSSHVCRAMAARGVKPFIAELRSRQIKAGEFNRQVKLNLLAQVICGDRAMTPEQLKALEIHNRMLGDNEPEQHSIAGLSDVLDLIRHAKRE